MTNTESKHTTDPAIFSRMSSEELREELAIQLGKLTADRSAVHPNRWGATDPALLRAECAAIEAELARRK